MQPLVEILQGAITQFEREGNQGYALLAEGVLFRLLTLMDAERIDQLSQSMAFPFEVEDARSETEFLELFESDTEPLPDAVRTNIGVIYWRQENGKYRSSTTDWSLDDIPHEWEALRYTDAVYYRQRGLRTLIFTPRAVVLLKQTATGDEARGQKPGRLRQVEDILKHCKDCGLRFTATDQSNMGTLDRCPCCTSTRIGLGLDDREMAQWSQQVKT